MKQLRTWLADRRAVRAEHRSGDAWLDYQRRRRQARRGIRAERRAHGRGSSIEPGTGWSDAYRSGGGPGT